MVIALATIMLVWFGVQEALASAQGGPGFNIAKVPELLHADYVRLQLREVLRRSHPRHRILAQRLYQWGNQSFVDYIGTDSHQDVETLFIWL